MNTSRPTKLRQFQQLKPFILGDTGPQTYADAAESLGCTPDAAKMGAHRMRKRHRQLLRDEIAQTVETPDDVEDEIRGLFRTFSG